MGAANSGRGPHSSVLPCRRQLLMLLEALRRPSGMGPYRAWLDSRLCVCVRGGEEQRGQGRPRGGIGGGGGNGGGRGQARRSVRPRLRT